MASARRQRFAGENDKSRIILLTDTPGAVLRVTFAAPDDYREPMEVHATEFIAVKRFTAKGKRLTTWNLGSVEELEPDPVEPETADVADGEGEGEDEQEPQTLIRERSDEEVRDEITGQERLFTDDDL